MASKVVKQMFRDYPRLTNSVVYGSFYVGAEFCQQVTTRKLVKKEKQEPLDWKALGRYLIVGSVINSNYLYTWYKWLDNRYKGSHPKIIFKKLFLDQFVMTPPLYVIFFVSMSLMEGKSDLFQECREKFFKTFSISCIFWIPAQVINFAFLPNAARIPYMGACSFIWVNILCWIKRSTSA